MAELIGRNYQGRYVRWNCACHMSHPILAPLNAKYYRHLGKQIRRCLIAHPDADLPTIAQWAYGDKLPYWWKGNIKRHLRTYGLLI